MTNNRKQLGFDYQNPCAILSFPNPPKKEKTAKNQQKRQFHDPLTVRHLVVTSTDIQSEPPATTTNSLSKGDPVTTNRKLNDRSTHLKKRQDAYVLSFYNALVTRFGGHTTYKGQEVADVIQFAVVELLSRVTYIMGKYSNPVHYAAARFANVNTDHARRQAAQRGEGARFERKVGSADVDHTARQLESIVSSDQFDIAEHLDNKSLVKDVLSVLSEVQQRAVILVFVEGYSVTEAAKILGKRRETVSRILRDAKIKANKTFGPAA